MTKNLWFLQANYFCQYFVVGSLCAYINPLLASCGLTSAQLGITSFCANLLSTLASISVGILADRTNEHPRILFTLSFALALSASAFLILPLKPEHAFEGIVTKNGSLISEVQWNVGSKDSKFVNENALGICWPLLLRDCHRIDNTDAKELTIYNLNLLGTGELKSKAYYMISARYAGTPYQSPATLTSPGSVQFRCHYQQPSQLEECVSIENQVAPSADSSVFFLAVALRCLLSFAQAPALNLLDSVTYDLLGEPNSHLHGRYRIFASIGYMLSVSLSGIYMSSMTTKTSAPERHPTVRFQGFSDSHAPVNYTPCIQVGIMFAVLGTIASYHTKRSMRVHTNNFKEAILLSLRSSMMKKCLINSFLGGLVCSILFEYSVYILTTEFKVPLYFTGMLSATTILFAEIPATLLIGSLIKRFGETACLSMAYFLYALWLLALALTQDYRYYLIINIVCGSAYPMYYGTLMHLATAAGDGRVISSMHGLMNATLFGLALCIGALGWGILLGYCSGRHLFLIASAASCLLCISTPITSMYIEQGAKEAI